MDIIPIFRCQYVIFSRFVNKITCSSTLGSPSIRDLTSAGTITPLPASLVATFWPAARSPLMAFSAVSTSVALGIFSIIIVGAPMKAAISTRPVNSGEVPSLGRGRSSPRVSQIRNFNLMLSKPL